MAGETLENQFTDDASGWARRWGMELKAAQKELEKWHTRAGKIVKRFKDEREEAVGLEQTTRWNLFTANVQTQRAMMYGKTPQVSVDRRFADADDDTARVAAEILQRLLNTDIARRGDGYALALEYALSDRLLPGCGNVRVRYVADFEEGEEAPAKLHPETGEELAPAVPAAQVKVREDVEVDYTHWRDQLWSPARVFHEVRWWAFKAQMSREELVARFGKDVGERVPLNSARNGMEADDASKANPWSRADVWEIWDKEHEEVFWYVEGFDSVLDRKPDTLELDGFWPFPRPMMANLTTDALVPRPDFILAQDLYNEIDSVSSRITVLEQAIRVTGGYDKSAGSELTKILEGGQNQLYPVENWAAFSEKGGLKGVIDWMPLDQLMNALIALRDYRRELMDALYQVTGMSDIMRGQASSSSATATEQSIKARFGSVRMQALQDEFARFASDVQNLKAEIIAKHFDSATILQRCNCEKTPDAALAPQAVELLKSQLAQYRVEVKPEAISLADFAALKQERTEVIGAISMFLTSAAPLAQAVPGSMPFLLKMLQASVAGLRGSSAMEGILDQAITAAEAQAKAAAANPQPQQQDPKMAVQQLKGQQDMAKSQLAMQMEQQKAQNDLSRIQAETIAHASQEQTQAEWNTREAAQKAIIQHSMKPQPLGGLP